MSGMVCPEPTALPPWEGPLTFTMILNESAARILERGFGRDENLDVSSDAWVGLLIAIGEFSLRRFGSGSGMEASKEQRFTFHGPNGRIDVRLDDALSAGTWKWREPSPFERWFPTHEDA